MLTILVFILVLSLLIFVHELGHFAVAKFLGIGVEEFGFGLPPRAFGIKRGETIYSLNWLPIGGFVRLAGEDQVEVKSQKFSRSEIPLRGAKVKSKQKLKRFFWARSKKERAAVLLAGVTMNFLLAVAIISFVFTQGVLVATDTVRVVAVLPDTPAAQIELREGDIIRRIDDTPITNAETLGQVVRDRAGGEVVLAVERPIENGTEQLELVATPRAEFPEDEGPLGIAITSLEERVYTWYEAPFVGLREALSTTVLMLGVLGNLVWRLITLQGLHGVDVGGPVAIAAATGDALEFGFGGVLNLVGLLSLNLAVVNLLPIPALDGGRLLFVVLEKFIGRRVQPRVEAIAHQVGMAFLLALIVLITINDILRIVRG